MAIASQSFSADGSKTFTLKPRRDGKPNVYTVTAGGSSFGSGTLAFYLTVGGVDYAIRNGALSTDTAVTCTANHAFNFEINPGDAQGATAFKATLTGSTSPSITVSLAEAS